MWERRTSTTAVTTPEVWHVSHLSGLIGLVRVRADKAWGLGFGVQGLGLRDFWGFYISPNPCGRAA